LFCLLEETRPSNIQHTVDVYSCQCHCFAISCCLDNSSRLVLLASKPRRVHSLSGLALWKRPLKAIFGGPSLNHSSRLKNHDSRWQHGAWISSTLYRCDLYPLSRLPVKD
jgi:hypothetical protein